LRHDTSPASCGILISLTVRYTCNTSMVSATATALRIFGPASAATPAAAESRSSAQFSAAPNWSFPLNHHFPAAAPHRLSLPSGQKSRRTFWPFIPAHENWVFNATTDAACLLAHLLSGSTRNDIRVGGPYQNHATLRIQVHATTSCFHQSLLSSP
jgi:hypothetical protein